MVYLWGVNGPPGGYQATRAGRTLQRRLSSIIGTLFFKQSNGLLNSDPALSSRALLIGVLITQVALRPLLPAFSIMIRRDLENWLCNLGLGYVGNVDLPIQCRVSQMLSR